MVKKKGAWIIGIIVLLLLVLGFFFQPFAVLVSTESANLQAGVPLEIFVEITTPGEVADIVIIAYEPVHDTKIVHYRNVCPYPNQVYFSGFRGGGLSGWYDCGHTYACLGLGYKDTSKNFISGVDGLKACFNREPTTASVVSVTLDDQLISSMEGENSIFYSNDVSNIVNNYCNFGNFDQDCRVPLVFLSDSDGRVNFFVNSESTLFREDDGFVDYDEVLDDNVVNTVDLNIPVVEDEDFVDEVLLPDPVVEELVISNDSFDDPVLDEIRDVVISDPPGEDGGVFVDDGVYYDVSYDAPKKAGFSAFWIIIIVVFVAVVIFIIVIVRKSKRKRR
jgi:hypothetical protein